MVENTKPKEKKEEVYEFFKAQQIEKPFTYAAQLPSEKKKGDNKEIK